jgi:hypothetical protein
VLIVEDERDTDALIVEVETVVWIDDDFEENFEENVETGELDDTTTGLRLLYIDNRFAPPHYESL